MSWNKPQVFGVAKKMDRSKIKSKYSTQDAYTSFSSLIKEANCKHIFLSYNNMQTGDNRSNSILTDEQIIDIMQTRSKKNIEIFSKDFNSFSSQRGQVQGHQERLFYCEIDK